MSEDASIQDDNVKIQAQIVTEWLGSMNPFYTWKFQQVFGMCWRRL